VCAHASEQPELRLSLFEAIRHKRRSVNNGPGFC